MAEPGDLPPADAPLDHQGHDHDDDLIGFATPASLQGRLRVSVAVISRCKVRDASSPGDADPRLRLVVVEYLDDSRHRLVEIHVDLHKPAVQSERKNEAQRVRGFRVENSERLHEVPVDEVADETQGELRRHSHVRVRLQRGACAPLPWCT